MAVSVAFPNEDLLAQRSRALAIPAEKSGIPDDSPRCHDLSSRITALVGFWEELKDCNAPLRAFNRNRPSASPTCLRKYERATRELFRPYDALKASIAPPPTYEESLQDLPPDYTCTDALATVHLSKDTIEAIGKDSVNDQKTRANRGSIASPRPDVDLHSIEGIREVVSKKDKKAAKKAAQAKWGDSDNEDGGSGAADGGDDGSKNGGGDAGSGAGGDGGDPPDGHGGEDGDDWFTGWGE